MFLKVSSLFLILGCFLTYNLALPSWPQRYASYDSSQTKGTGGKPFEDFTHEIEKSLKQLTQTTQWSYNNVVSVIKAGFENGFETMTGFVLDSFLRMEFFMIADGSHFMFPLSEKYETEQQYRAVATAVSKLVMNLRTMERADKVMKNVTKIFVSSSYGQLNFKDYQKNPEKIFRVIIHEYFKTMDHQMEIDQVLRDEYKKLVDEARETVKREPKMHGPLDELYGKNSETKYFDVDEVKSFLHDKKTFRRAIANKYFLKESIKHFSMIFSPTHHQRYLLARALIQKAITSDGSKVNDIYQRALAKAGEVVMDEDPDDEFGDVLFDSLEKALESDHVLYGEVKALMKQLERTTAYNIDMLYVDFSIL